MVRKVVEETPQSDAPKPDDWRRNLDSDSTEYQLRDFWEKYSRRVKLGVACSYANFLV